MPEEELLKEGIAAARAGNMKQAAALFAQVVRENPSSEQGWFLLGMSSATTEQREYCLRRTLAINPNHPEALKRMAALSGPADKPVSLQPAQPLKSAENIQKTSTRYEGISKASIDISENNPRRLSSSEVDALVTREMREKRREGTFSELMLAAAGGFLAAVVVSIVWAFFSYLTMRPVSIMALGLGMVVGLTIKIINRNGNFDSWILAAVFTLFGCFLGNYLVISTAIASGAGVPVLEVVVNLPFRPEIMSEAMGFILSTRRLVYYALGVAVSLGIFAR